MANAKHEFLTHIPTTGSKIKCASIMLEPTYLSTIAINLVENFTDDQSAEFLAKLDFDYDAGYGTQYLYGYIWYEDGTWSERSEYDGSEWWRHKKCPPIQYAETYIPDELTHFDGDETDKIQY